MRIPFKAVGGLLFILQDKCIGLGTPVSANITIPPLGQETPFSSSAARLRVPSWLRILTGSSLLASPAKALFFRPHSDVPRSQPLISSKRDSITISINNTVSSSKSARVCETVNRPYVSYSGPASAYPSPSSWASWSDLWSINSAFMPSYNTASEISMINSAITSVASDSGIDPRVILCVMMQESSGNVRVPNTSSWEGIVNTGLMQANHGVSFDPPNPQGSITQMIKDGVEGTASGFGLKQAYAQYGNYYMAMRKYNSGSVDESNLNDGLGATGDYVNEVANKLMGAGAGTICAGGGGGGSGVPKSEGELRRQLWRSLLDPIVLGVLWAVVVVIFV